MAQVLVRDVPSDAIGKLKRRARRKKHSLQNELREAIVDAAQREDRVAFVEWLREFRRRQAPSSGPDSVTLLRRLRSGRS